MKTPTRQLATIINGQNTSDGAGVKLKRIISPTPKNTFDPFILLDEFGSDEPTDYLGGFPDHPHRGFETVTYMGASKNSLVFKKPQRNPFFENFKPLFTQNSGKNS